MSTPKAEQRRVFAKRLTDAMHLKGFSQMDMVRRVSEQLPGEETISRQFMSMLVKGMSMPGPNIMIALCKVLNVIPSDLDPSEYGLELDDAFRSVATQPIGMSETELVKSHLATLPKPERALESARTPIKFEEAPAEIDLSANGNVRIRVDKEVPIDKAFRIWEILNS